MAKMCLKKQSKRTPAKRRYKIEKRVRQHNKKKRREEKHKKGKKSNKVITVPHECPFKEQILKDAEEYKRREKEEWKKKMDQKNAQKASSEEVEMKDAESEAQSLDDLLKSAQSRQNQHQTWNDEETDKGDGTSARAENSLKAYYKEFRKVVEAADVVLEVVDARDPIGTRCKQVEESVREATGGKRLVLVLNKADLVPKEVLDKWLKYLRRSVPAIAFKASTQQQKRNLSRRKAKSWSQKEMNVSPCVGAEVLMSLLGNYCRNKGIKTAIHVGIVGLPNVGKSSIINSLKRSRACNVGAMPGVTKNAQVVELDKKIKLLDSPGIVFASAEKGNSESDAATVLKNAVHVQTIADPITPAIAILQRANKQQIMEMYNLPEFDTHQEFFASLAQNSGKFKRGGIPDSDKAARQLIDDWNKGKIKYYTLPPETDLESHVSAAIVKEIAAEFDLDSFKEVEAESLEKLGEEMQKNKVQVDPVILESSQPVIAAATLEDENMEDDDDAEGALISDNVKVVAEKRSKPKREGKASLKEEKKDRTLMELEGNQKLNLHKKLSFKKLKKMQTRNSRKASALADVLENFSLSTGGESGGSDKYDFNTDFSLGK